MVAELPLDVSILMKFIFTIKVKSATHSSLPRILFRAGPSKKLKQ